jgi:hypothetical protein
MLGARVSSELAAREQAGAALANACANCYENQIAARHAGAVHVLLEELQLQTSPSLLECSLFAMRNLCINCLENQEELSRCNGMIPLLKLLHSCMRQEILEVVASTLVKVCVWWWRWGRFSEPVSTTLLNSARHLNTLAPACFSSSCAARHSHTPPSLHGAARCLAAVRLIFV